MPRWEPGTTPFRITAPAATGVQVATLVGVPGATHFLVGVIAASRQTDHSLVLLSGPFSVTWELPQKFNAILLGDGLPMERGQPLIVQHSGNSLASALIAWGWTVQQVPTATA